MHATCMYIAIIHLLQICMLSHTCQVDHSLIPRLFWERPGNEDRLITRLVFSEHDCTVKVQIRTPAAVSDRWRSECVPYRVWRKESSGWAEGGPSRWAELLTSSKWREDYRGSALRLDGTDIVGWNAVHRAVHTDPIHHSGWQEIILPCP